MTARDRITDWEQTPPRLLRRNPQPSDAEARMRDWEEAAPSLVSRGPEPGSAEARITDWELASPLLVREARKPAVKTEEQPPAPQGGVERLAQLLRAARELKERHAG